jgi:dynein heavy chain 1
VHNYNQLMKDFRIFTSRRLPYTPCETFDRLLAQTMNIFRTWDDPNKEFTNVIREVTRKRSEKFIPIKVQPAHAKLQERKSETGENNMSSWQ